MSVEQAEGGGTTMVEEVTLPALDIKTMELKLIGDSPMIQHKFSEKARKQIEEKQAQKASAGRKKRDPKAEYKASMHEYPGGGYGFPAGGIKKAAIRGVKMAGAVMTDMRAAFHVVGEGDDQLVKIDGKPSMRTDMVRLQGNSADIRYRGQFKKWSAKLLIRYNARAVSPEQIANFFRLGGFGNGLGENRPQYGGSYGMFHVAMEDE